MSAPRATSLPAVAGSGAINGQPATLEPLPPPDRSERDLFRGVVLRLATLTAVLLLLSQGVVSYLLATIFEDSLLPEIHRKAEVAGELATEQIADAVALGIPLDELVAMDEFLQGVIDRNPDFTYLAVLGTDDAVLYAQGSRSSSGGAESLLLPVVVGERTVAFLQADVHEGAVRSELAELRLDIATVFLATLLVGIELLVAFVVVRISGPIQLADRLILFSAKGNFLRRLGLRHKDEIGHFAGAYNNTVHGVNSAFASLSEEAEDARAVQLDRNVQQRIRDVVTALGERFRFTTPGSEETLVPRSPMDVRVPLFLFMLSQELSRPFLPLFFGDLYTPIANLSRELAIGLPITTFMVMVLISIPIAGAITDRVAPRAMFVIGIVPSVAGHVGAALSDSIVEALLWWSLAGVGYGTIFISAQAYVAHHTEQTSRAVGMTGFLGAVFAAFVCGPAIGGILADRLGYEATLLVAAGLGAFSAVAALITVDSGTGRGLHAVSRVRRRWRRLILHRDFVVLTLFSALPAKLVLGGLFFYLIPLFLTDLGNSQSNVGRVMMVFGIACVAITPLAARRSDRIGRPKMFVTVGGLVIGIGCLLPIIASSTGWVLAAVAVMGAGHALVTAPQLAVIQQLAETGRHYGIGPGVVVGAFRTVERIGTAAGALVVGAAVTFVGYAEAMFLIGALVIVSTGAYFVLGIQRDGRPVAA